MPTLSEARGPDDMRLYAVGDVHGRLDLLRDMHARIGADLAARPCRAFHVVHCGDYIDRGPDSRGVIAQLAEFCADGDAVCLAGNHDLFLWSFLHDPAAVGDVWLSNGGEETLASWGVESIGSRGPLPFAAIRDALDAALSDEERAFFAALEDSLCERWGDFLFVHAGVRPDLPLERQRRVDLFTIREPFLSHEGDFGLVVVHGHTISAEPAIRRNRVGIDTGAWRSGRLTCFVVDGAEKGFLEPEGYAPLPDAPR